MKNLRKLGLGLVTTVLMAAPVAAEEFVIDSTHADVIFAVNHLGLSNTYGRFGDVKGVIDINKEDPSRSSVNVEIMTASVDTNLQARDDHLRTPDFLDVKKFPTITFISTKVGLTGENTAKVTGDLTMHGVTRSVTLDVKLNMMGKHPMSGDEVVGFSATTSLLRSDYGISTYVPAISDDIDIIMEIEAARKKI